MKLRLVARVEARVPAPVAVLAVFEGSRTLSPVLEPLQAQLGDSVAAFLKSGAFKGESGEVRELTPGDGKFERVLIFGLGKKDKLTADALRKLAGNAQRRMDGAKIPKYASYLGASVDGVKGVGLDAATVYETIAEGMLLGGYQYRGYKTDKAPQRVDEAVLFVPRAHADAAKRGQIIAEGTLYARDLINSPANYMTPSDLADAAARMARNHGVKVTVWNRQRIERERMHLLLGVSRGSVEEPRFVVMEYGKPVKGKGPLVFVGKGITFDSGGISIKPAANMEQMKYDMSGAAAVVGAMMNVARLQLKGHFVGLFAASENMPGGKATKPGDVHNSRDGKTVEIINTDAEGRLILADALSYAKEFKPSAVVDNATLTGACVIALGHAIGAMGNDAALMDRVRAAAEYSGERLWELPMWDEYADGLKSAVADLRNVTGGRGAGTISAAKFLEKFTDYPWVHLDIAGAAWEDKDSGYRPRGAAGAAVRVFTKLADGWFR